MKYIKFLNVSITMQAKTSTDGADRAINKFGWAAIILALCIGAAGIIAALGVAGVLPQ